MRTILILATLFAPPLSSFAATIETVPVSSSYRMGKYEVTNAQYVEFLNSVDPAGTNSLELYSGLMSTNATGGINLNFAAVVGARYEIKPGHENKPVVYVSWYDAARFTNWLNNGQSSANTESGSYNLLGGTATPTNGQNVVRQPTAVWVLPTQTEWMTAAFKRNGSVGADWTYPTQADATPFSDQPPGDQTPRPNNTGNFFWDDETANGYNDGFAVTGSVFRVDDIDYLTNVGAYQNSPGPFGTFDQLGNVWEWTESRYTSTNSPRRGILGLGWTTDIHKFTRSGTYELNVNANLDLGFRVAMKVPEPSALLCTLASAMSLACKRRRSR